MASFCGLRHGRGLFAVTLWLFQIVLAFVYGASGLVRMSANANQFTSLGMDSAVDVPEILIHIVGLIEILCAIGIVFPALLGTQPRLTRLSAAVISVIEALPLFSEVIQGRFQTTQAIDLILLIMALSVLLVRSNWTRLRCSDSGIPAGEAPSARALETSLNKSKSS
jgi:uncharacterized membrane protein YphA (DoxX/SURF4 family)